MSPKAPNNHPRKLPIPTARERAVEHDDHSGETEGLSSTPTFEIDAAMARIDGALGAAGHAITDPAARKNLRELADGEITPDEARADVLRRAAERGAI